MDKIMFTVQFWISCLFYGNELESTEILVNGKDGGSDTNTQYDNNISLSWVAYQKQ